MTMTRFNQQVIGALKRIPRGKVTTYGQIAKFIKKPKAARAVGNACHKNPGAPAIPCHRVVKSDGSIGDYAKGIKKKIELLKREGVYVVNGKVKNFEKKLFKIK